MRGAVVSRVKLPQPGSGKARVSDITAGAGRAGEGCSNRPPTTTPPQDFYVATPASAPDTVMASPPLVKSLRQSQGLRRSNSENNMRVLSPRHLLDASPRQPLRSSSGSRNGTSGIIATDLHASLARHSPERSQEASGLHSTLEQQSPVPSKDDEDGGSLHQSMVAAESQSPYSPPSVLPRSPSASSTASSRSSRSSRSPRTSYSSGGAETVSPPRSQDPAGQAADQPLGSASVATSRRSVSEPPPPHQQRPQQKPGRLSELVDEVAAHLEHAEVPLDTEGWQQETIKLEQFAEEMQALIDCHKQSPPISARQPPDSARRRELSVLKGDKDLRWARQQLRNCEKEHAHMVQLLGTGDNPLEQQQLAELKALEEQIEQEQQRQKHLAAENRLRERSLARMAKEGGEEDGNVRAVQQIERLEKELEVWIMKNGSLEKQVQNATDQLEKAREDSDVLRLKQQKVSLQLASKDQQQRIAEERAQQEKLLGQEQSLRESVGELKEERKRAAKAHERAMKEKGRTGADLQKQLTELETRIAKIDAEGRVLKRQLKQQLLEHSRSRHTPSQPSGQASGQAQPQQPLQQQQQDPRQAASAAADGDVAEQSNLPDTGDVEAAQASNAELGERAAVMIQRHVRGHHARRAAAEAAQAERAAVRIQSHVRGHHARRASGEVARAERAAVTIQRHVRGHQARGGSRIASEYVVDDIGMHTSSKGSRSQAGMSTNSGDGHLEEEQKCRNQRLEVDGPEEGMYNREVQHIAPLRLLPAASGNNSSALPRSARGMGCFRESSPALLVAAGSASSRDGQLSERRVSSRPGVRPGVPQVSSARQGSDALVPRSQWTFRDDEPLGSMPARPVEHGPSVACTQVQEAPERPAVTEDPPGCTAASAVGGTSTAQPRTRRHGAGGAQQRRPSRDVGHRSGRAASEGPDKAMPKRRVAGGRPARPEVHGSRSKPR